LDWMKFPFSAPEHTVLMGLNSIGGTGGLSRPDGSEMFFAATGALAAGGRSVVLSRWNAGGQMQVNLAAQYARNATAMPVTMALQSAARHVRGLEVDVTKEPRLKQDAAVPKLTASSPFFWASPVLVSYDDQRAVELAALPAGDATDVNAADLVADSVEPDAGDGGAEMNVVEIQPQPVETAEEVKGAGDEKTGDEKAGDEKTSDDSEDEEDDDQGGAIWKIGGSKK